MVCNLMQLRKKRKKRKKPACCDPYFAYLAYFALTRGLV